MGQGRVTCVLLSFKKKLAEIGPILSELRLVSFLWTQGRFPPPHANVVRSEYGTAAERLLDEAVVKLEGIGQPVGYRYPRYGIRRCHYRGGRYVGRRLQSAYA